MAKEAIEHDTPAAPAAVRPDISKIALECARQAGGDVAAATHKLQQRLQAEWPVVYAEMASRAMADKCESIIRSTAAAVRGTISHPAVKSRGLSVESMKAYASSWMDWMVGTTALRNATRQQLLESSDRRLKISRTEAARGQFERAIADRLPDDDTPVGKALKERDVAALAAQFKVSE